MKFVNRNISLFQAEHYKLIGLDPETEQKKKNDFKNSRETAKAEKIARRKKREKRVKELKTVYAGMRRFQSRDNIGDEEEDASRLNVSTNETNENVSDGVLEVDENQETCVSDEGDLVGDSNEKNENNESSVSKKKKGHKGECKKQTNKKKGSRSKKCPICGKQQSWLKRHLKSSHGYEEKDVKLHHKEKQPKDTKNPMRKCPFKNCSIYRTRFETHWKSQHNVSKEKNPDR